MEKHFCVISHTHWDREWYMPLSQFRLRLVDLIDRCLQTLEQYPAYVFHLDAQTIVLEDYLAVRPTMEGRLREMIRTGRLIVGPWYLQNDFYLTSGEATVRNLLEGTRIARNYGACETVGYAPDQFGNISQLPQILRGFGIDNFIFGRGYSFYDPKTDARIPTHSEFCWQGPDGSELLAIHMPYWYNNAQRFSKKIETSSLLLDVVERLFDGVATTPYLLLMNGVDHLEAQGNLLPILDSLRQKGRNVRQWQMGDYVAAVRQSVAEKKIPLQVHKGELRSGNDWELLTGTHSSRAYLKQANVRAQDLLEGKLEPLYAMLEAAGGRGAYSTDHLRYLWKQLLQNHPHDSICGCSRDEVHDHMEDNYRQLEEAGEYLLTAGLRTAAEHFSLPGANSEEDSIILVVNPTQCPTDGVVEVELDLLDREQLEDFTILDANGNPVPFAIRTAESVRRDVFSPVNLPGWLPVQRYQLYLLAEAVQGMAARGFRVTRGEKKPPMLAPFAPYVLQDRAFVMENTACRVSVQPDGGVSYLSLADGRQIDCLLEWEDRADPGDSYVYYATEDAPVLGSAFPAQVLVEEDNEFFHRCTITRALELPATYDFANKKRSATNIACTVSVQLSLPRTGLLQIGYTVDNHAEDHRLRLLIGTGVPNGACYADIPFDLVRRLPEQHYHKTMSTTFPNTTFALLQDADGGVAVATEGIHEFEHLTDGMLAFTVLRATGVINREPDTLLAGGGKQWHAPGNQCKRKMSGRFGVLPYQGDSLAAGIAQRARQFRTGLLSIGTGCDPRKFSGGRTAVQDTALEELFYLADAYPALRLEENCPMLQLEGDALQVTATKKAEEDTDLILRIVNLSEQAVTGGITVRGSLYRSTLAEQQGELLGAGHVALSFRPKEIMTLRFRPEACGTK